MGLFEPRIGLKPLAALCRRLSTSLSAGVDVRNVWLREAAAATSLSRRPFDHISHEVAGGASVAESISRTGNYFPKFFREMIKVGEQSGHLPEVLRRLADHYEHQLKLRRMFWAAIAWPAMELIVALCVVGVVIWLPAAIPQLKGADLLGIGLTGNSGLATYLATLAMMVAAAMIVHRAAVRGMLWVAPVQRVLMALPQLGQTIETLALARLTWALHVTLNAGMELRSALRMSLESTHNVVYLRQSDRVLAAVRQGREVHEALAETGAFPPQFVEMVRVGEESGTLVETMAHLSEQYQERARLAMNVITVLMGVAVFAMVAVFIAMIIFRMIMPYFNLLNDLSNPRQR